MVIPSLHSKTADNAITQFFPVEPDSTHQPFFPEVSEHEVEKEAHRVLAEAVVVDDNSTHEALRYEAFRAVQDLSETASMFYKAVGELCPTAQQRNLFRFSPF